MAQAETVELRAGALLDVPVVADRGEDVLAGVAGGQRLERVEDRGHAQHVGDAALRDERQRLRQVTDGAVDGDRACGGPVFAGDQPQQRALACAVGCDQPGAAVADGEGQIVEQRRVIGPGKGQI